PITPNITIKACRGQMHLYDFMRTCDPDFDPATCKVHLPTSVDKEQPLDVFLDGRFDEWQSFQGQQNFKRKHLISFVGAGRDRWLFAGYYRVLGWEESDSPRWPIRYNLERIQSMEQYVGRLYVHCKYGLQMRYINTETLADNLYVTDLLRERRVYNSFPGFKKTNVTMQELRSLFRHKADSWRAALSSVKGIYLITDQSNGKLYVGQANGTGGFWDRWRNYAETGHGGNKYLIPELKLSGEEHSHNFRFSILEVCLAGY
ncbi:GIY-YIG nuclease family protein, partial [Robbsia andropogonis]|uniref:GIY-YIG nuclease family protein n=1 Tax=Robbsia andropogonis TaxID=28092 RepID=UPI001F482326